MTETTKTFEVEVYVTKVKSDWEIRKKVKSGWFTNTLNLGDVSRFIYITLDEAIRFAETKFEIGTDKKAFVLEVLRRVYDTVIQKNLPMWAWPFSSSIKSIVIDYAISELIDYIVKKYNSSEGNNWKS